MSGNLHAYPMTFGQNQMNILKNALTTSEFASLSKDSSVANVTEILGKYPGLAEALIGGGTNSPQINFSKGPTNQSRAGFKGVDPYGPGGFAERRTQYVNNNQEKIKNRRQLQSDLSKIAISSPPGLDEKIDPKLDPFVNPQFIVKLWRLISVIEVFFVEDAEPTTLLSLIEDDIVPKPESWDFVIEQYYECMCPIFDDIDRCIDAYVYGNIPDYGFLVKMANVSFFNSLNVEAKIKDKRLNPTSKLNLMKALKMLNSLSTIHHFMDPSFFLDIQGISLDVLANQGIEKLNDVFKRENFMDTLSFGSKIASNIDMSPFITLMKHKQHWPKLRDAMSTVSDIKELSNLKNIFPILDEVMVTYKVPDRV